MDASALLTITSPNDPRYPNAKARLASFMSQRFDRMPS
jgi:hypothetical protein